MDALRKIFLMENVIRHVLMKNASGMDRIVDASKVVQAFKLKKGGSSIKNRTMIKIVRHLFVIIITILIPLILITTFLSK